MNLSALIPQFQGNAETLVLLTAMHYAATGKVDLAHIDSEGLAVGLFSLAARLEVEHPGIAERYGWAKISDLQAFSSAIGNASQATKPSGLQ
jgi:hypothetical protein